MRTLDFLKDMITDPVTKGASSARIMALIFGIVGCVTALLGMEAGVVAALVGGGSVALLTRKQAEE